MLGDSCIPSLMLLLGATLAAGPAAGARGLPPTLIAATAAARLLVLPLLGVGWVLLARAAGLFGPGTPRLLVLVILIQNAVP